MTLRRVLVVLMALALVAAGCSRDEDDPGATGDDDGGPGAGQEEATTEYDDPGFGNIEEVCGEGGGGGGGEEETAQRAQDDATEAQGVTDEAINIGTVADPGFEGRQGLNQEIFDASEAFVEWCNSHGGINGREINLTLYDAAIQEYQPQMEQACGNEFVMVGSGAVQDNLWVDTGLACDLVEISAFAVTPEHAGVTGTPEETAETRTVQPLPNPSDAFNVAGARLVAEESPEAVANAGILYGDFETLVVQKDRTVEAFEQVGWEFVNEQTYNILGEANWGPFVTELQDAGVEALHFVGEGQNLALLQQAMQEQGYEPEVQLMETNMYDPTYLEAAASAAEGTVIRSSFWPIFGDEAQENPATAKYLTLMEDHGGKVALLGAQATSAWLLFAQAARACDDAGDLTRSCILDETTSVTEWDGGGLHAPGNPGENQAPECQILFVVENGEFVRRNPETPDGGENGYLCESDAIVELEGDFSAGG